MIMTTSFTKKNQFPKGNITVEAAIIYPIVFLVLAALFFFMIGLFRQVYVQYVADLAAERGSQYMQQSAVDMDTGYLDQKNISKTPLYFGKDSNASKNTITSFIASKLQNHILTKGWVSTIDVSFNDYIIYKELNVKVNMSYPTRISMVDTLLGSKTEGFVVKSNAKAVISDPAEFIRNVDMTGDLVLQIPGMSNYPAKYSGFIKDIKTKINGYFVK